MLKPLPSLVTGNSLVTPSEAPAASSRKASKPTPHQKAAKMAVDRLFDLLPAQDIGNPEVFLAACVALFAEQPPDIMQKATFEIARRSDRPTLKLIADVLDEFNERALEMQRVKERMLPPPPRAPRTPEEQARIDKLVSDTRRAFGLPEQGPATD